METEGTDQRHSQAGTGVGHQPGNAKDPSVQGTGAPQCPAEYMGVPWLYISLPIWTVSLSRTESPLFSCLFSGPAQGTQGMLLDK